MQKLMNILKSLLPRRLRKYVLSAGTRLFPYRMYVVTQRLGWLNRKVASGNNHIQTYWQDTESLNRKRLIDTLVSEARQCAGNSPLSILEYGSHVGINIKLLKRAFGQPTNVQFFAVEPNVEAFKHMKEQMPDVHALNGEDKLFTSSPNFPPHRMDISFANAVFYSMDYKSVLRVCRKLLEVSDVLVIGDELCNLDGDKTILHRGRDYRGNEYTTLAHPYKRMLATLGCRVIEVLPVDEPQLAVTGIIVARK